MMGSGFHNLQVEGLVVEQEQIGGIPHISDVIWKKGIKKESIESEPTSVLDHRCSPNSPNSASTRSSSINGGGGGGVQMQDLEGLTVGGEGSLLPWFMGQVDDPGVSLKNLLQSETSFGFDGYGGIGTSVHSSNVENFTNFGGNLGAGGLGFCSSGFDCNVNVKVGEQLRISDEKPQVVNPQFGFGEQEDLSIQNPNYYAGSLGYSQVEVGYPFPPPPMKRHNYGPLGPPDHSFVQVSPGSLLSERHDDVLMPMAPLNHPESMDQDKDSQLYVLRDQLIKVSEMFQTGNFALAQVILARLNHQASLSRNSLVGGAALCVKEELEKLMSVNGMPGVPPPPKSLGLDDVIHKISAYKLFSEVSPVMQFLDFTCTQVFLEALEDAKNTIHILDFDIGCGSMWASFIRELPLRKNGAPFLKITVLASTSSHHPFELALICDNILEFATEYGVSVDIKVLNLDLFDSGSCSFPGFQLLENEVVAVKFPIWACSHCPFLLPPLVSFIKQCSPKVVMSFDRGGDRCELAFPSHILHALNSCSSILESLNGSRVPAEIITKIDTYLIRPSVERIIEGRIYAPDKMQANKGPNWRRLFPSSGFAPSTLSNMTEYQAHELVTKLSVKGFNVEKRGASIVLRWLSHELVGGFAWSC
ncbi:scarecrow-like protein 6 [Silene latifolia]|uniref:scarecrow-like protein 6 n=1 Tax=Silene latifolia TaxID=37657 RepID=UPI003D77AECB